MLTRDLGTDTGTFECGNRISDANFYSVPWYLWAYLAWFLRYDHKTDNGPFMDDGQ